MSQFNPSKYLGKWYELAHYPSWFQDNDNYNTTATYTLDDGKISVLNSTYSAGRLIESLGTAHYVGDMSFNVNFSTDEVNKLIAQNQNIESYVAGGYNSIDYPNYVIDKLWTNKTGDYMYSIVTDPSKKTFYLLSRTPNPTHREYSIIMNYVATNFDRKQLVQTPHYKL